MLVFAFFFLSARGNLCYINLTLLYQLLYLVVKPNKVVICQVTGSETTTQNTGYVDWVGVLKEYVVSCHDTSLNDCQGQFDRMSLSICIHFVILTLRNTCLYYMSPERHRLGFVQWIHCPGLIKRVLNTYQAPGLIKRVLNMYQAPGQALPMHYLQSFQGSFALHTFIPIS